MKKVLIVGIGNVLLGDEGIGVYIANQIRDSGIINSESVEVADGGTAGYDLLPMMMGRDRIVIIDALNADDVPGSVYRLKPENLAAMRGGMSLHETGIPEVIRALRLMGESPEVEIIGIVPEDITTVDIKISDAVLRSVPAAIAQVVDAAMH